MQNLLEFCKACKTELFHQVYAYAVNYLDLPPPPNCSYQECRLLIFQSGYTISPECVCTHTYACLEDMVTSGNSYLGA